jgi:enoyl-CoA hydratase
MAETGDVVLVEVDDRVAVVTLNRPDQRNALNRAVRSRLPRAIRELDADAAVDVVILTGADPAFCAGVDLKEFASGTSTAAGDGFASWESDPARRDGAQRGGGQRDAGERDERGRLPFRGALPPHEKLLIGAINGVAVTGGFELALNCDFMIASDRARFADTHARVGVMPGWGLTVLLAQRIGVARARQMSVTGNYVDARTAYEWGLVNEVVEHDRLLARCRELALDAASIDQRAVRRMLATYREVTDTTVAEGWEIESRVSREWEGAGFDPAEIEARRRAVVARGRDQIGRDQR